MRSQILGRLLKVKFFKAYYLGRSMAGSAKTIKLEEGRPFLPNQVDRMDQYSEFQSISTQGINSEIPRHHFFVPRWRYKVKDAILDSERGDVYLDRNTRVYESSNWHPFVPEYLRTRIPNSDLSQVNIGPVTHLSSWTYFHFLIENLPAFLAASESLGRYKCVIAKDAPKYVNEALEALDADVIRAEKFVRVHDLVFCGKGSDTGWMHPKDLQIVRRSFQEYLSERVKGKSLYVSRRNSSRSPINELILERMIAELGIEIIYPEELSFVEQVVLFSSAEIVIGVHGAGLANQIWMNPESTIIEIIDVNYYNICFESLAAACNHHYSSVLFDSVESSNELPLQKIINKCKEVLT